MRQMQNRPLRPGAVRRTREGGSLYNPFSIVYNRENGAIRRRRREMTG